MNMNFFYFFLLFIIYSFIGYIVEVINCSVRERKFVNRGFLCGPYCPIYGVGAVAVILLLLRFQSDPVLVFLLGALITTSIEYITSFILEKIFHNKWWDYTGMPMNLNGRVCLQNALLFGFGTLVILYVIQPFVDSMLSNFSNFTLNVVAIILLVIFLIDCVYSFIVAYNLRNRLIICEELKKEKLAKIPGMVEKLLKKKVAKYKTYPKRLLESFPDLRKKNEEYFELMKKIKDKRKNRRVKSRKDKVNKK